MTSYWILQFCHSGESLPIVRVEAPTECEAIISGERASKADLIKTSKAKGGDNEIHSLELLAVYKEIRRNLLTDRKWDCCRCSFMWRANGVEQRCPRCGTINTKHEL